MIICLQVSFSLERPSVPDITGVNGAVAIFAAVLVLGNLPDFLVCIFQF